MTLIKCYKFRIDPTPTQRDAMGRMAGCRRFVWNWALAESRRIYLETGKGISRGELSARLTNLKQEPKFVWLRDVDSQSLQESLASLNQAFRSFFAKRSKYPRFKSKKSDPARFAMPQRVTIADGKVYIPKVGHVKIRQSQPAEGNLKGARFRQDATGKWGMSIVAEFEMPDVALSMPADAIGIDLGLKDFATLSTGEKIPAPKFYRKFQRKLRAAQRMLSRRMKGSQRRLRAKRKVAVLHRKIANQRQDFIHKFTTAAVNQNQAVCIEDLSVKGLAKTKLAKSIHDASFGEARRQLEYKALWNRKPLAVISRWFPSSKACGQCGLINEVLQLSDRKWTCECGIHHDRDFNAACNIRNEGMRILAAGHAESLNARRADVTPAPQAIGGEA